MVLPSSVGRWFVGSCLWLSVAAHAFATGPSEQLDYTVSYRGIFSLGQDLPIADLVLETRSAGGASGLRETRLEASSAAYPTVESVFPIRYRFRTWTTADEGQLVGFETYEKMRKHRHRLYLRDDPGQGLRRYDLRKGAGQQELAQLDAGMRPPAEAAGELLLDRLGLLQRVRTQELREDAEYRLPVTNGRERLVYRVRVEGAELLNLDHRPVPAWRLRFDGLQAADGGPAEPSHQPVYIWLSQAPGHVPLRADSRQPVGLFRIELNTSPALEQLATAGR